MFLAKLLVGSPADMNRDESEAMRQRCHALTVPPENPANGLKYNTVTGNTGGSKVYIVYENGRAYPEYLIRYYRGGRDSKRTPFATRKDVIGDTALTTSVSDASDTPVSVAPNVPTWEFRDNSGWKAYGAIHQQEIEAFFTKYMSNPPSKKKKNRSTVVIKTDEWEYVIDVARMKQTNCGHPGRRERDIQRLVVGPNHV
jgi:hypothetical protein